MRVVRNQMRLKPVLLLCLGIVFTTAPLWADRVPCCDVLKGSPVGISTDVVDGFETGYNDDINMWDIDVRRSEPSLAENAFIGFVSSRDEKAAIFPSRTGLQEHFSDHMNPGQGRFDTHGDDRNTRGNSNDPRSVPEPGSLALLLLGVTAVGIFACKRADSLR